MDLPPYSLPTSVGPDGKIVASKEAHELAVNVWLSALYAAVESLRNLAAAGAQWKQQPARVASGTNVNIANALENGDTLDGVTLATGDRVLLFGQTAASQNGLYVVAASGAATRATDADSGAEVLAMAIYVRSGTLNGGKQFICTTPGPITLGTTALAFAEMSDQSALNSNVSVLSAIANRTVATVTGTGDAMIMTTSPALTAYADGQVIRGRPPATNTIAGVTMNVDGVGVANVYRADGTALRAGDLVGGQLYDFVKFGTNSFRVMQWPQAILDVIEGATTRTVATVTGTGNAMVMTTNPKLRAYTDGQVIFGRPPSANTISAVTMAVDGLAAANVVGPNGSALRPGDLVAGVLYQFAKFGTNTFRVVSPPLAINVSRRSGPLLRDYKLADIDTTGRVTRGVRRNGQTYLRGQTSSGGGGGADYPRITFQHAIDGAVMPEAAIDVGIFIYGQSLGIGYTDAEYYAASAAYNSVAVSGAFMPSVGNLPGDQEFTAFTGLLEQKHVTGFVSTVETIASEMAKQLKAEWTAAGFTDHPRIVVAIGGDGGQRIQNLMRGSAYYKQFLDIIARCARVSADAGKRLVVYAVPYLQGEANRVAAESYFTTRAEYKSYLLQLQRCLEQDIRLITGQIEPVRMVLSMIARNNGPSEINAAQLEAALSNPDQISIFDCCYAWEHGLKGSHPLVAGYRRGGWKAGRAIAGNIFGNKHRLHRVTRHWLQSTTEFRFTTDLPIGATALVKDSSGTLVSTTGMDAGAGWIFTDKDGAVPISASAVVGSSGRVGTGSVTFGRAVHESSLIGWYAMDGSGYPVAAGDEQRPRGLFRADDGVDVADLALPTHSFLLPWSTR